MASILVLDGGLGTSLEDQYGVKFDHSMPLWSTHFLVEGNDTLLACQRDFARAGADIILTATYQTSVEGFLRTRTKDHPQGIPKSAIGPFLNTAVTVAEQAKDGRDIRLALSLGPYGACMVPGQEYSGKYDADHDSEEPLTQWHLERLQLFTAIEGLMERVQYIALETIPRLDEIRAVRKAITRAGIDTPFWISCVFPGDSDALPDGSTIEQVVHTMLKPSPGEASPAGIGINCTKIHKLKNIVREYESAVRHLVSDGQLQLAPALVLYPDGTNGEVYNTTTKEWERPEGASNSTQNRDSWAAQLAGLIRESRDGGIFRSFLVGGCCKASAGDISALRKELSRSPVA